MDENKKRGSNIETTTLEKVPMEERKGWIDVAPVSYTHLRLLSSTILTTRLA